MIKTLSVVGLHRDLVRKRSIATIVWEDDPEKTLAVAVPFECPIDQVKAEAEKSIRVLARELETAIVQTP